MWLRDLLLALTFWTSTPTIVAAEPLPALDCAGQAVQGGLLICQAPALSQLTIANEAGETLRTIPVNQDGIATIGLKRAEALSLNISIEGGETPAIQVALQARDDPFRTIEGLECDKVDARTPEQIEHAGQSWVKKQAAFKTFHDGHGATRGFMQPADGPMSSPFGPARKYIGVGTDGETCEKTSVHRGYDMAVPIGTPIVAPADGTVLLGDPDLYYEGGTVFLDHGDGLVSVFMHMSAVEVEPGQTVERGARLGASGNTGRTTGPHLHWAVKWRNPGSGDRGGDFYIDPALLLALTPMASMAPTAPITE